MTLAFDIVLSGLVLGGMYALIALGLTLQYGIARIMNLSYGEALVAAAFAALYLYTGMAVNPLLGLVVVVPASFAANWLLYQIVLMPLVQRARNQGMLEVDSILGTFGILFVIQGVMLLTFGGTLQSYSYLSVPVHILGTTLALNRILALLFALMIGGALYLLFGCLRAFTLIPVTSLVLLGIVFFPPLPLFALLRPVSREQWQRREDAARQRPVSEAAGPARGRHATAHRWRAVLHHRQRRALHRHAGIRHGRINARRRQAALGARAVRPSSAGADGRRARRDGGDERTLERSEEINAGPYRDNRG